jgi:hypothetical protein
LKLLRRRRIPRVTEVTEQLAEYSLFPAIWFIFSRKQCDQAVEFLHEHTLTSPEERDAIKAEVRLDRHVSCNELRHKRCNELRHKRCNELRHKRCNELRHKRCNELRHKRCNELRHKRCNSCESDCYGFADGSDRRRPLNETLNDKSLTFASYI